MIEYRETPEDGRSTCKYYEPNTGHPAFDRFLRAWNRYRRTPEAALECGRLLMQRAREGYEAHMRGLRNIAMKRLRDADLL